MWRRCFKKVFLSPTCAVSKKFKQLHYQRETFSPIIYLSIFLSIYLSIYIYIYIYLPIYLFIYISIYLTIHQSIDQSIHLSLSPEILYNATKLCHTSKFTYNLNICNVNKCKLMYASSIQNIDYKHSRIQDF